MLRFCEQSRKQRERVNLGRKEQFRGQASISEAPAPFLSVGQMGAWGWLWWWWWGEGTGEGVGDLATLTNSPVELMEQKRAFYRVL